jgi:HIV Tat-specific factor 1
VKLSFIPVAQVYVVDEEGYQRLVDLGARQITDKSRDEVKKSFVADDGVRYMWDEAEQTWIEDDDQEDRDDDDEDDDDDDDEEGHTQGGPGGNRGSIVLDQTDTSVPDEKKKRKKRKQRRPKKQAANMWVYITGLPADTTLDEIKAHFSKVGLIAISAVDQQPKIKLYLDETGVPKGDCSICYNAEQSVQMAVEVLSGGYLRPSHQVTVTRAEFSIHESRGDDGDVAVTKKQKTISHQQVKVWLYCGARDCYFSSCLWQMTRSQCRR